MKTSAIIIFFCNYNVTVILLNVIFFDLFCFKIARMKTKNIYSTDTFFKKRIKRVFKKWKNTTEKRKKNLKCYIVLTVRIVYIPI